MMAGEGMHAREGREISSGLDEMDKNLSRQ